MIDLRSDTLTLPTPEMLASIPSAHFGDSGRWNEERRGEDGSINKLEDKAAELMGKEAAAFCGSGTMGNSSALLTHCRPGDCVLVDDRQHLYRSEKGIFNPRIGQLIAVVYAADENGYPDVDSIETLLKEHHAKVICVENTHNNRGGLCLPLPVMKAVYETAHRYGAKVHLDGARIFNAAAALGVAASEIAQYADSVMFCVSKGLGAPVGSLVCGTKEFIYELRETRRILGGDMRQAGVLAAPALYALEHNIARLADDNRHAAEITAGIRDLKTIRAPEKCDSNIVMLTVPSGRSEELRDRLKAHGVISGAVDECRVRLVLHQEIKDSDTAETIRILRIVDGEMSN